MSQYFIPESAIDSLETKLATIRRKCAKYGCEFSYSRIGETFKKVEIPDDTGNWKEVTIKAIEVEVSGTAIAESGWELVGKIEHLETGNLIHSFSDVTIPDWYRSAPPKCEHCSSDRHRKETYVLYHAENHAWKQVGSSCLKDFTGNVSAEMAAAIASVYTMLDQVAEDRVHIASSPKYFDIESVICYAIECVKHWGYHKSKEGNDATREAVRDLMRRQREFPAIVRSVTFDPMSAANLQTFKDMRSRLLASNAEDDYTNNLQVLLKAEAVPEKHLGILVSAVPYYNRMIAREAEQRKLAETSSSEFIGNVGDRLTVDIATVTLVNIYDGYYGGTWRYQIVDAQGNVFMWDASNTIWDKACVEDSPKGEVIEGLPLQLIGTVKKHDEFRGVKQTWLTRCRVTKRTDKVLFRAVWEAHTGVGVVIDPRELYRQLSNWAPGPTDASDKVMEALELLNRYAEA